MNIAIRGSHQPDRPALGRGPDREPSLSRCCSSCWASSSGRCSRRHSPLGRRRSRAASPRPKRPRTRPRPHSTATTSSWPVRGRKRRRSARTPAPRRSPSVTTCSPRRTPRAERIAAAGRAQLDAQRSQIVAELRADLGRVSVELASKVVGESLQDRGAAEPDGRALPGRPGPLMQHIASRESLDCDERFSAVDGRGRSTSEALTAIGFDLEKVSDLFLTEVPLRRTLSETTLSSDTKSSIAEPVAVRQDRRPRAGGRQVRGRVSAGRPRGTCRKRCAGSAARRCSGGPS